jgi:DNA-binding IclR family transcriptional regulator
LANKNNIRSIERALEVLECFQEFEELNLSEISKKTNLTTSTVYRIVITLENLKYLLRNENNKKYYLGPKFLLFSRNTIFNMENILRKAASPFLFKLKNKYNQTAAIYVLKSNSRVCLDRVSGTNELSYKINIGDILPLTKGAAGKILISYLDQKKIEELNLSSIPDQNIIKEIHEKGYSISIDERLKGISSISSPIFDLYGNCVAAIIIAGPTNSIISDNKKEIINDVKKYALEISEILGYRSDI